MVKGCGETACETGPPVDCKYGDWGDWGQCDKCDGERKRLRQVEHFAENGGENCAAFDGEEVGPCPRSCSPGFCSWGSWGSWGACSGCGRSSRRERKRSLAAGSVHSPPASEAQVAAAALETQAKYAEQLRQARSHFSALKTEVKSMQSQRSKQVMLSFGLGLMTVPLLLVISRLPWHTRNPGYSYLISAAAE